MKTQDTLSKSVRGCLKHALAHSSQIDLLLTEIKRGAPLEEKMPKIRAILPLLTQRVHEMSAYHNALETD